MADDDELDADALRRQWAELNSARTQIEGRIRQLQRPPEYDAPPPYQETGWERAGRYNTKSG
eukprot:CAMPEP_0119277084 /NCGR_PEP_ID=MMETSP1329-20130426/16564_1 /TAXON_ID=114041 /ORGANISM="Genus nov. species nov., Strain RCC1024" /LENGTH=61 /DNA_ID=CAMNT_0007277541 /DNA_START=103 /DNA_END=284 /DNA_ORIENTATION=+